MRTTTAPKVIVDRRLGERSRWCFRLALWCAVVGVVSLAADACGPPVRPNATPAEKPPASALAFTATAYCTGKVTASGTTPNESTVAADPRVLPMGTRISLAGLEERYNRTYVVMDSGPNIRGHRIDLYMRDCREAVAFGRRPARVSVLNQ